jgi:hypothetical protein
VIKSKKWEGTIALLGEMHTTFWSENLKGRDHSEDLSIDGKIILEWIFEKQGGKVRTGCIWLRIVTSGRLL